METRTRPIMPGQNIPYSNDPETRRMEEILSYGTQKPVRVRKDGKYGVVSQVSEEFVPLDSLIKEKL